MAEAFDFFGDFGGFSLAARDIRKQEKQELQRLQRAAVNAPAATIAAASSVTPGINAVTSCSPSPAALSSATNTPSLASNIPTPTTAQLISQYLPRSGTAVVTTSTAYPHRYHYHTHHTHPAHHPTSRSTPVSILGTKSITPQHSNSVPSASTASASRWGRP